MTAELQTCCAKQMCSGYEKEHVEVLLKYFQEDTVSDLIVKQPKHNNHTDYD